VHERPTEILLVKALGTVVYGKSYLNAPLLRKERNRAQPGVEFAETQVGAGKLVESYLILDKVALEGVEDGLLVYRVVVEDPDVREGLKDVEAANGDLVLQPGLLVEVVGASENSEASTKRSHWVGSAEKTMNEGTYGATQHWAAENLYRTKFC
jgi:hypothetical protein